jgi:hypothetical protein
MATGNPEAFSFQTINGQIIFAARQQVNDPEYWQSLRLGPRKLTNCNTFVNFRRQLLEHLYLADAEPGAVKTKRRSEQAYFRFVKPLSSVGQTKRTEVKNGKAKAAEGKVSPPKCSCGGGSRTTPGVDLDLVTSLTRSLLDATSQIEQLKRDRDHLLLLVEGGFGRAGGTPVPQDISTGGGDCSGGQAIQLKRAWPAMSLPMMHMEDHNHKRCRTQQDWQQQDWTLAATSDRPIDTK